MSQRVRILFVWVAALAAVAACSRGPQTGSPLLTAEPGVTVPAGAGSPAVTEAATPAAPAAIANPTLPGELPPPQTFALTDTPSPGQPPVATQSIEAQPRQLTQGGCCVQPFWSPDSRTVLFLDRPDPSAVTGIWGVSVEGGTPGLVTDRLGVYSADMQLRAFPESGQTVVERMADGQRWIIPNGGRAVSFSPGGAGVAWTQGQSGPPFDTARREIWIGQIDGSQAQQAIAVTGGGFSGWMSDTRFLINGRPDDAPDLQALWAVDLAAAGGAGQPAVTELVRAARIRSTVVSPGGGWLAYLVTSSDDPAQDGLWLVDTAGGQPRRLDVFGGYRWRDAGRLLVIPLEPGAKSNRLVQVDAATGMVTALTDPDVTAFKIAGGDWSVSPDGSGVVFVAEDGNLWVMQLP